MPELEDISPDELDSVLRAPQPKARKRKKLKRDWHDWFYETEHSYGTCSNPDCKDPRQKDMVMVATVDEHAMCRYCFLGNWEAEDA